MEMAYSEEDALDIYNKTTDPCIISNLFLKMYPNDAIRFAWDYFYKAPYRWNGHSSKLNLKTRLGIYYEEDGNEYPEGTILHYTDEDTIYGTSTDKDKDGIELGEQPIFYYGSFEIDNFNFELCFDTLKEGRIEFIPRKDASFDYIKPSKQTNKNYIRK